MDINPYQPPQSDARSAKNFQDSPQYIAELERRVAELELQASRSWSMSPSIVKRVVAVWGYFVLGYAAIAAVAVPILLLLHWLGIPL